ncbi:MAG: hypothetical protein HZB51_15645 [Chloroflexi bacterium]|nr:hypothetical protein [Chloroflexota bacterium]
MWQPNSNLWKYEREREEQESAHVRNLLVHGIAAAKGKSKQEARNFLDAVLKAPDANVEQRADAYWWLAEISDDPKEKRECYQQILCINPADPGARRALMILDGKLDAQDIVDPNKTSSPVPPSPLPVEARRYVCSNCGGKMAFTPDGNALMCTYCGHKQSLLAALDNGAILEEQDLMTALVTGKGHKSPVATQSIKCQGCGALFILPPQRLAENCPYCASAYVVESVETRDLIPPEGVIPFAISRDQAHHAVFDWYRKQGYRVLSNKALPSGVYLPVWTFDLTGEITWTCQVEMADDVWVPKSGAYLVYENDMLVAASHTLGAALMEEINQFPLNRLALYDPRYLVDWACETYQISVSDSSLVARTRVLEKSRSPILAGMLESNRDLRLSTLHLVVESFKLILVPLWIARYQMKGNWYTVVVNGQTGKVRGEKPNGGIKGWFSSLLND